MNRKRFLEILAAGGASLWGGLPLLAAGRPAPGLRPPAPGGGIAEEALRPRAPRRGPTMFRPMPPELTGIVTENRYDDPSIWWERYAEFEVGSIGTGVAIGDYDGDGRPDIFVVSKTESCRLFRNRGDWKFEDVTAEAGVGDVGPAAKIWKQGAVFADVDNNGLLDLYVCRFGAPNLLYINQGDGTFKEEAAARGLAVDDGSVMAAFCDYDRDGWLDVLVQTNAPESPGHPRAQRNYLFHNNGDGTFTDVTARAGISGRAQGHSAIWWDFDNDGWPDLYVANDFSPPDQLFRNNRDGTFTDVIDQVVPHTPFSSMGADLGDVNNDGLIDFFVADMAASTHEADQRTMANARDLLADPADGSRAAPEYMRNALYLNTGTGRCQEGACLAGLAATDWTWSVRLEDLDNDGRLDLFATNGMYREVNNVDLLMRMAGSESAAAKVGIQRAGPEMPQRHFAFRNRGELRFEDASAAWGLDQKGISFGAAFGDLDGDGNLDLVYANYHGGVTVLRNEEADGHRILVALRGTRSNRFGVGATVRIETEAGPQVRTLVLARGILSGSEPVLHFGLGEDARVRRLSVEWPSGHLQVFEDLAADRRFTVTEPAGPPPPAPALAPPPALFADASAALNFSLSSREAPAEELAAQPLLPLRQNRRGPALALGDLDGDGRDEVVLGGTALEPARVLRLGPAGGFEEVAAPALAEVGPVNDGPILLFDADGDGGVDLLVTRAGSLLPAGAPDYQPRLLLNRGGGRLEAAPAGSLPELPLSVGAAVAADFDRDGRLDVFLGGRVLPGRYPLAPESALLANRGGRFEDVTDRVAPGLRRVGLVTSALWSDVDGDGWPDLLVALEWGQVKYFHNDRGRRLEDWTERAGFAAAGAGWWTSLAAADLNGEGRLDYVVGNVGLNTPYRASPEGPALLYAGDFNGDGSLPPEGGAFQLIEAYHEGGRVYPRRTRRDLGAEIPSVLARFPSNDAYARATLDEVLGAERLARAARFSATELRSGVFRHRPDGTFQFEPLPRLAQLAPLQGLVAGDLDGDGRADVAAVQNSYAPIPSVGRFDGGLGQMLRGGALAVVPPRESGLIVPGDAKALALADLTGDGWPSLLASRNNGATLAFRRQGVPGRRSVRVALRGPAGNPTAVGARLTVRLADGSAQAAEIHAGSGYYSQSTAACFFGYSERNPPQRASIRWPSGAVTEEAFPGGLPTNTIFLAPGA